MKTPVNKQSLKHHFTYNWWKYLFVLIAGIFLVDLLFTVTTPKIPEDKRIDFYVYGYVNGDSLGEYMEEIRQHDLPDVEYTSCISLSVDDTYGAMQLTTYIAAQEGDLYLLPRDEFLSLSSAGAFLPLEDDEELMAVFNEAGINLRRGWRTDSDTGETHLYGIPLDFLPGLSQYCYAADGSCGSCRAKCFLHRSFPPRKRQLRNPWPKPRNDIPYNTAAPAKAGAAVFSFLFSASRNSTLC